MGLNYESPSGAQNPISANSSTPFDMSKIMSLIGLAGSTGAALAPSQDSWQHRLGSLVADQVKTQQQNEQSQAMINKLLSQYALGQDQVRGAAAQANQGAGGQTTADPATNTTNPGVTQNASAGYSSWGSLSALPALFGGAGGAAGAAGLSSIAGLISAFGKGAANNDANRL